MDWPLTLGMGTFPAGTCFALDYIIITLGSVSLELVEVSGNVPNSYWWQPRSAYSLSKKRWLPKILWSSAAITLKWDLWFSEFLPNLKYLRKLRRIRWKKASLILLFLFAASHHPYMQWIYKPWIVKTIQKAFFMSLARIFSEILNPLWTRIRLQITFLTNT